MHTDNQIIYRNTLQKQRILEVLRSTKLHPTADWIYERVKKSFPKLSLGTVYRNLKILKEHGEIQELPFGDTFDRFDGNASEHPHFVCRKCDCVIDLSIQSAQNLENVIQPESGFKVEKCMITFFGLCNKCNIF